MIEPSSSSGAAKKAPLDVQKKSSRLWPRLLLFGLLIVLGLTLQPLVALALRPAEADWHSLASNALFVVMLAAMLVMYVGQMQQRILRHPRRLALLILLIVAAGAGARTTIAGHVLAPYLFPMAAVSMLISVLLDVQLAIVVTGVLSLFVGFVTGGALHLIIYALLSSMLAALMVSRLEHLSVFAWAAMAIGAVNAIVAVSFRLLSPGYDLLGLLQLVGTAVANGILSSSLTFTTCFWLGGVFGITTPLQLVELTRPTHPLARRLLQEAPGTYHHSLMVGNLAEHAADLVGADPLLVRAAALHHDVGKSSHPYFYIENQASGDNYHHQLDAKTSAQIIISHVQDSLELGRKHHFPEAVLDIIAQHHGTSSVGLGYFYQQACKEENGQVKEADFHYPGPRPQTKEAAILMLADGVEAAVRAAPTSSESEIERIVRRLANDRLVSGEFSECDLTLRDLEIICNSFIGVLHGIFHPRIVYPEKDSQRT